MRVVRVVAAMSAAVVGFGMVGPAVLAEAPWGAAQTISTSSPSESPQLVMSSDGATVIAVWNAGSSIVARRSLDGGATWQSPTTLATDSDASTGPQIVASSDATRATVVWKRSDKALRSASTSNNAATWSTAVPVADADSLSPRIAGSADGQRLTAIWWRISGGNNVVYASTSTDAGASWGPEKRLSSLTGDAAYPLIASSADGQLLTAAWSPFGGGEVRAVTSVDGGQNWESPVAVQPVGGETSDLTAAADGSATVAWKGFNGSRYVAYASSRKARESSWASPVEISTDKSAVNPQVVSSRDGLRMGSTWKTQDGSLQVATSDDGGAKWGTPQTLTYGLGSDFDVAISRGGRHLVAVWVGPSGSIESATSQDAGVSWSSAVNVVSGSGTTFYPKVVSAANGSAVAAVWHRNDGGGFSVESSRAAIPVSAFSASSLNFGDQTTGRTTTRDLAVTNSGTAPLVITEVAITGAGYAVQSQTCTATPTAPGGTCTVSVGFTPSSVGKALGEIRFTDNTDEGVDAVMVSGNGVSVTPTPTPTPEAPTRLAVTARKGTKIPLGKKSVLISAISTDGTPSVRVSCNVKKKQCAARVSGTRVTAKPSCSKGLRITAKVSASKSGAPSATWQRTWKVKAKKPVKCSAR